MIAYIKGKVLFTADSSIILENNDIGYEINCARSVLAKAVIGKELSLSIFMSVRDDGIFLYGFNDEREKKMFLKLISVSGVGPKTGMTILSGMELSELAYSIASSDVKRLSSVKGLGKKTAERIILELREAVTKDGLENNISTSAVESTCPSSNDAVLALMSLGYSRLESENAVNKQVLNGETNLESLIMLALKSLAKA